VYQGALLHYERRLSANQGGGDDTIVIFEVAGVRSVREGSRNMTDTK
jgi:hypothetical protein